MDKHGVAILGPLGPVQLACLRSWRKLDFSTTFIHSGKKPLPKWGQGIADHYSWIPRRSDEAAWLRQISQLCSELNVKALACVDESIAELLNKAQSDDLFKGVKLLVNTTQVLLRLESKHNQIQFATAAGFDVLPTIVLSGVDAAGSLADSDFPLVVRPDLASKCLPVFKMAYFESKSQLATWLKQFSFDGYQLLAQRYISGDSWVVHGMRTSSGLSEHIAFRTEVRSGGLSVSIVPTKLPAAISEACRSFSDISSLHGVYHFDLIQDEKGQLHFLEVNPRMGGTTAKVFAAGYDEPAALLFAFGLLDKLPAIVKRKGAVNRVGLVRSGLSIIRRNFFVIDSHSSHYNRQVKRVLKAFFVYEDEFFFLSDLGGTLAYVYDAVG